MSEIDDIPVTTEYVYEIVVQLQEALVGTNVELDEYKKLALAHEGRIKELEDALKASGIPFITTGGVVHNNNVHMNIVGGTHTSEDAARLAHVMRTRGDTGTFKP